MGWGCSTAHGRHARGPRAWQARRPSTLNSANPYQRIEQRKWREAQSLLEGGIDGTNGIIRIGPFVDVGNSRAARPRSGSLRSRRCLGERGSEPPHGSGSSEKKLAAFDGPARRLTIVSDNAETLLFSRASRFLRGKLQLIGDGYRRTFLFIHRLTTSKYTRPAWRPRCLRSYRGGHRRRGGAACGTPDRFVVWPDGRLEKQT